MTSPRRLVSQAGGTIAFGSLGASYSAVVSNVPGRGISLHFISSLDGDVTISLDGGTTDFITIPPGATVSKSLTLDLGANGGHFSGTISAKRGPSGASTVGFLSVGVIRVN